MSSGVEKIYQSQYEISGSQSSADENSQVIWDKTPHRWHTITNILEEFAAPLFEKFQEEHLDYSEDGESRIL